MLGLRALASLLPVGVRPWWELARGFRRARLPTPLIRGVCEPLAEKALARRERLSHLNLSSQTPQAMERARS